jgi:branched-chain amino acid transport system substrate-binding protein
MLARDVAKSLKGSGAGEPRLVSITGGRKDYAEIVARLSEDKTEALFFAGFPPEAALVLRGLRRANLEIRFLGSDALATADFSAALGAEAGNLAVLVPADLYPASDWEPDLFSGEDLPRSRRALIAATHAAIEAWAEAARRSGSRAPEVVGAALAAGPIMTRALGSISFDENGDVRTQSFVPARWDGEGWNASQ